MNEGNRPACTGGKKGQGDERKKPAVKEEMPRDREEKNADWRVLGKKEFALQKQWNDFRLEPSQGEDGWEW